MKKELTLVVMAAGMGSRFGGLKQIEEIGPSGEFITDYSVYDAKFAGFNKVIFIIKRENLDIFRNTIEKRIGNNIKVEYAFQSDEIEYNGKVYKREKPWGTAHAIYSIKDLIDGDFIVINSDDFYGRDAYYVASKYFESTHDINNFALVGYEVKNTLTENGSVKRGIIKVDNEYLTDIIESKVEEIDGEIVASPLSGAESFKISSNDLVSMNMLLFTPYIFKLIEEYKDYFIGSSIDKMDSFEYLIPDLIERAVKDNKIKVEVLGTDAKWEGVTYKEDKDKVVRAIRKLVNDGIYKDDLWQD